MPGVSGMRGPACFERVYRLLCVSHALRADRSSGFNCGLDGEARQRKTVGGVISGSYGFSTMRNTG